VPASRGGCRSGNGPRLAAARVADGGRFSGKFISHNLPQAIHDPTPPISGNWPHGAFEGSGLALLCVHAPSRPPWPYRRPQTLGVKERRLGPSPVPAPHCFPAPIAHPTAVMCRGWRGVTEGNVASLRDPRVPRPSAKSSTFRSRLPSRLPPGMPQHRHSIRQHPNTSPLHRPRTLLGTVPATPTEDAPHT
jgi:hypothetical protein